MALPEDLLENLDTSWPDDLREYARKLRKYAEPLRHRPSFFQSEDARTLDTLAAYAETKAWAMEKRAAGHIVEAMDPEASCERLYESLPDYAKW